MGNLITDLRTAVNSPEQLVLFVRDRASSIVWKDDLRTTDTLDVILEKRALIPLIVDPIGRARVITNAAWFMVHFVHGKEGRGIAARPDVADLLINYLLPDASAHASISNIARTINVICSFSPEGRLLFSSSDTTAAAIIESFFQVESVMNVTDLSNTIRYIIYNDTPAKLKFLNSKIPVYTAIFSAVDRIKAAGAPAASGPWSAIFPKPATGFPFQMTSNTLETMMDVFSMLANCHEGCRLLANVEFCSRFIKCLSEFYDLIDDKTIETVGKLICFIGMGDGKHCFLDVNNNETPSLMTRLLVKANQSGAIRSICHAITTIANIEAGKRAMATDSMLTAILGASERVVDIVKRVREEEMKAKEENINNNINDIDKNEQQEKSKDKIANDDESEQTMKSQKKKSGGDSGDDDDVEKKDKVAVDEAANEEIVEEENGTSGAGAASPNGVKNNNAAVLSSSSSSSPTRAAKIIDKTKEEEEQERRQQKKLARTANESVYNARAALYHVVHCISSLSSLQDRSDAFCVDRCLALFRNFFITIFDDLDSLASTVRNTDAEPHNTQIRTAFQTVRALANMTRTDSGRQFFSHPDVATFLVNVVHELAEGKTSTSKELLQQGVGAINNLCKRNRPMILHFIENKLYYEAEKKKKENEKSNISINNNNNNNIDDNQNNGEKIEKINFFTRKNEDGIPIRNGATALLIVMESPELATPRTLALTAYCLGRIAEVLPLGPTTMNTRKETSRIVGAFAHDVRFEGAPYFLRLLHILIEYDTDAKKSIATNRDNIPAFAAILKLAAASTNVAIVRELLTVIAFTLSPVSFITPHPSVDAYNFVGLHLARKSFATSDIFMNALLALETSPHYTILNEGAYHVVLGLLQRGVCKQTYPLPSSKPFPGAVVGRTIQELRHLYLDELISAGDSLNIAAFNDDVDFGGNVEDEHRTDSGRVDCLRCKKTLRNLGNSPNCPFTNYNNNNSTNSNGDDQNNNNNYNENNNTLTEAIADFAGATRPRCPYCSAMFPEQLQLLKSSTLDQVVAVLSQIRTPTSATATDKGQLANAETLWLAVNKVCDLLFLSDDDDDGDDSRKLIQNQVKQLLGELSHFFGWINIAAIDALLDETECDGIVDALLLSALPRAPTAEIVGSIATAAMTYCSPATFSQKSARLFNRLATPAIVFTLLSTFRVVKNTNSPSDVEADSADLADNPAAVASIANLFLRLTYLVPGSIKMLCQEETRDLFLSFLERTQNPSVATTVLKLVFNIVTDKEASNLFASVQRTADVLALWLRRMLNNNNNNVQPPANIFTSAAPILDLAVNMSCKVLPENHDRFLGCFSKEIMQLVDRANAQGFPVGVDENACILKSALCINNITWNSMSIQVEFAKKEFLRSLILSLQQSRQPKTIEWLCGAIENISICDQGEAILTNKNDSSGVIPTFFGVQIGGPLARQASTLEAFKEATASAITVADTVLSIVGIERMYNFVLRNEKDLASTLMLDSVTTRVPFQGVKDLEMAKRVVFHVRKSVESHMERCQFTGLYESAGFKFAFESLVKRFFGEDALTSNTTTTTVAAAKKAEGDNVNNGNDDENQQVTNMVDPNDAIGNAKFVLEIIRNKNKE